MIFWQFQELYVVYDIWYSIAGKMGVFQYFVKQPITPVWVGCRRVQLVYVVFYSRLFGKRFVGMCVLYVVWGWWCPSLIKWPDSRNSRPAFHTPAPLLWISYTRGWCWWGGACLWYERARWWWKPQGGAKLLSFWLNRKKEARRGLCHFIVCLFFKCTSEVASSPMTILLLTDAGCHIHGCRRWGGGWLGGNTCHHISTSATSHSQMPPDISLNILLGVTRHF